jgi:hypothetical protein
MERSSDTRRVNSLVDLRKAEGEIVARLMSLPNGGLLFLLDPVRSLADVGVELSDRARAELAEIEPNVTAMSAAYDAVKNRETEVSVDVRLVGLFDWGSNQ